jgi:hypothetical protein
MGQAVFYLLLALLAALCAAFAVALWRRRVVLSAPQGSLAGQALRTACRALGSEPSDREPLCALFAQHREGLWSDRAFAVDQLIEQLASEGEAAAAIDVALERWVAEQPDEALGQLLLGARQLCLGWPAAPTERSPKAAPERARAALERADQALRRAADLDPDDPTPRALAINVATALGQDEARARELFAEVREREPQHLCAHVALLRYLGPRWHGSTEQMFRFVRSAVSKVGTGSPVNGLLAYAHLEAWRALRRSGDSRGARAYLDDPSNRVEVQASFGRFRARDSGDLDAVFAANHWACWFYLTRDRVHLRALTTLLIQSPTQRPWCWLGSARRAVKRALRFAG